MDAPLVQVQLSTSLGQLAEEEQAGAFTGQEKQILPRAGRHGFVLDTPIIENEKPALTSAAPQKHRHRSSLLEHEGGLPDVIVFHNRQSEVGPGRLRCEVEDEERLWLGISFLAHPDQPPPSTTDQVDRPPDRKCEA